MVTWHWMHISARECVAAVCVRHTGTMADRPRVSRTDRAALARQASALAAEEHDDEGSPEWQAMMRQSENRRRAEEGLPPLKEWWEEKPEPELHRRARALGLLARDR